MPGFDRTGPRGEGPRTGRELGRCVGLTPEDWYRDRGRGGFYGGFGRGRGFGGGRGRGLGRRRGRGFGGGRAFGPGRGGWWWDYPDDYPDIPPLDPDDEIELLKRDESYFKRALKAVRDRIAALRPTEE